MFTDRLLVTLVHLRTGLTHEALGVIHQVGSSTIGRAIGGIRPLLAERGFAVRCCRAGRTTTLRCAPRASLNSSGSAHA
ncbi:transposase family protein [Streptomyces sp. NPDC060064]|uniref:helix-turn-helix domain-containing protein n=1 Tax=Streptomyces sp. NPDC060064 TaxID=3347049 RepID=UPI003692B4CC